MLKTIKLFLRVFLRLSKNRAKERTVTLLITFKVQRFALFVKAQNLKIIGISGSDDLKYSDHYKQQKKKLPNFLSLEITKAGHNPHKTHLNELKLLIKNHI